LGGGQVDGWGVSWSEPVVLCAESIAIITVGGRADVHDVFAGVMDCCCEHESHLPVGLPLSPGHTWLSAV
jgi:hypothetical protein